MDNTIPKKWDFGPIQVNTKNSENCEQDMAEVRLLHAGNAHDCFHVTVGSQKLVSELKYGEDTEYQSIPKGESFVSVTEGTSLPASGMESLENITFEGGKRYTIVVVQAEEGVEVYPFMDEGCKNMSSRTGSIRVVNLSEGLLNFDVLTQDGTGAFADLRHMDITPFKQAEAGVYDFYIVPATENASTITQRVLERTEENLSGILEPESYIAAFSVKIRSKEHHTAFILGKEDLRIVIM